MANGKNSVGVLVWALFLVLSWGSAGATLYSYADGNGVVNVTDRLEKVPAKYRASMKVTAEEKKKAPAVQQSEPEESPAAAVAAAPEAKPTGWFATFAADHAWFKPLVVVAGIFGLFLVAMQISSQISSPQLAKLVYLVFFAGVGLFVYVSYSRHMVESTISVKQKLVGMFKKANVREVPPDAKLPAADR